MKSKLFVGFISIIYLFIICIVFSILSININSYDVINNDVSMIDIPNNNITFNKKKIIDEYIDKYNNQDVVGEIKIINTDYKKAIMQSSDNNFYLNHLEDKTSSYMGSIYLDFRIDIDNDNKLLIFGHNSDTIDMPFKVLENYYSKKYYDAYKYIQITTKNNIRLYEIYSVIVEIDDFSYMRTEFENNDDWYQHIKSFKNNSMYDTGVDIDATDNILILQTCSTHHDYKKYAKKYLLIVAKEIYN